MSSHGILDSIKHAAVSVGLAEEEETASSSTADSTPAPAAPAPPVFIPPVFSPNPTPASPGTLSALVGAATTLTSCNLVLLELSRFVLKRILHRRESGLQRIDNGVFS